MEQKPISTTIFRFVSLRPAERSGTSSPLSLVRTGAVYDRGSFVDYVPVSAKYLKEDVSPELYLFAEKVLRGKKDIKLMEVMEYKEGLSTLNADQLNVVWSELLYQCLHENDQASKRAAATMLMGNHIVAHVTGSMSEKAFREVLDARIVTPKEIFEKEEVAPVVVERPLSFSTQEAFEQMKGVLEAQATIPVLKGYLAEIPRLEKLYAKSVSVEQAAYNAELKEQIDAILAQAAAMEFESKEEKNEYYSNLQFPPNEFAPSEKLLEEVMKNNATIGLQQYWKDAFFVPLVELKESIQAELSGAEDLVFGVQNPRRTYLKIGGAVVPGGGGTDPTFDRMTFKICPFKQKPVQFTLTMLLPVGETLQSISYKLLENNVELQASTFGRPIQNPDGTIGLALFGNQPYSGPIQNSGLEVQATITTNSGKTFRISTPVNLEACTTGKIEEIRDVSGYAVVRYGVKNIGVADYRKVEQTLCCYVAGEVSHIENLMAREMREKVVKTLRREETQTTSETTSEEERLTETSSTERHEMNKEISKLQQESMDFAADLGIKYGSDKSPWSMSLNTSFAYSTSKEESERLAITEAKELTERAMDRVVTKSRQEIIKRVMEEYSEQKTHIFDNRQSPTHISGVFRWVDKVYKNEIYNYGKRMMLEFAIPEPAKLHYIAKTSLASGLGVSTIEEPIHPKDLILDAVANVKLDTPSKLNRSNYLKAVARYNATVDAPPAEKVILSRVYTTGTTGSTGDAAGKASWNDLKVPEGYSLAKISGTCSHRQSGNPNCAYTISIGNQTVNHDRNGTGGVNRPQPDRFEFPTIDNAGVVSNPIIGLTGEVVPVGITTWDIGGLALQITAEFKCSAKTFEEWQLKAYADIMEAYQARLDEYQEATRAAKEEQASLKATNPLFYREIEKTVLRKNCVEYLIGELMGRDDYQYGSTLMNHKVDLANQGSSLDDYASHVKFIEQAFEWEIMSYQFYPFYWGQRGSWDKLYNFECEDKLFTKFMQSGLARVVVTARPGFEKAVNWFMATGQIWNGGDAPIVDDELYLAIDEEMRTPEFKLDGSWETRIPSSLTVIQSGVIGLAAEGLPCDPDCNDGHGSNFGQLPDEVLGIEAFPPPTE